MADIRKAVTSRSLAAALLGGAMVWFAGGPAVADTVKEAAGTEAGARQLAAMEAELDQVKSQNGIRYACTGVGDEAQDDPQWSRFPAKLVFAVRNGDYLTDVAVQVTEKGSGEVVYDGGCKYGPWLMLDLPAGSYEVTAEAGSKQVKTVTLDVGDSGQTEKTIIFDADDQT